MRSDKSLYSGRKCLIFPDSPEMSWIVAYVFDASSLENRPLFIPPMRPRDRENNGIGRDRVLDMHGYFSCI